MGFFNRDFELFFFVTGFTLIIVFVGRIDTDISQKFTWINWFLDSLFKGSITYGSAKREL